jgi:hypothetical protein
MLKGLRFQKRLRMLPGVRANLSKSGVSASLGPRGASVNVGRDGVTTNAGIPGTGLSYRQKITPKNRSAWIGVAALLAGLAFAGWQNRAAITAWVSPQVPAALPAAAPPPPAAAASAAPGKVVTASTARKAPTIAAQRAALLRPGGVIYVRRAGSVLREAQKPSAKALAKLPKGARLTVVTADGPWTQVRSGDAVGWMRTSVLGPKP